MMVQQSKESYIRSLLHAGDFEEAKEKALLDQYEPLFKKRLIHPEEPPIIKEYNTMLLESKIDINALHYSIMVTANHTKTLADTIALRLKAVELLLQQEKEMRDDMKLLCGAYEDFEDLIIIDHYINEQNCDYSQGVFKSKIAFHKEVAFAIESITGNGIEGNAYVLDDNNRYLEETLKTNDQAALKDNDLQTSYEYARIIVPESETLYAQNMHKDNLPARCDIILKAEDIVSECQINGNVFLLNGLSFSQDGFAYSNALLSPVTLDHSQSIPSTGYIAFPSGRYIKLSCESIGATTDKIGFEAHQTFLGENHEAETEGYDRTVYTHVLENAKRKAIRIDEIKVMQSVYEANSFFTTKNLLNYPVQAIALYADTYIPEHFKEDDYILFELNINGTNYPIVPINSELNGIKIIKTSTLAIDAHYGIYIDEPITDVRLTVRFKCPNENESAVLKHIRLLVGEKYET